MRRIIFVSKLLSLFVVICLCAIAAPVVAFQNGARTAPGWPGLEARNEPKPRNAVRSPTASIHTTAEAFTEPFERIQLAAAESGILTECHVKVGDRVKTGLLLASLDISVLQTERDVAQSRANSTAAIDSAQAQLRLQSSRLDKLQLLARQGAGSSEEISRAQSEVQVASANLRAAREDALQNALTVKRIDAQMERRRIRTTIDGVVVALQKKPGEYISATDPVVAEIVNLNQLRARFHLRTSDAVRLRSGMTIAVEFPHAHIRTASPSKKTSQRTAPATVEYVSPVTDAASDTVRVDVVIPNSNHAIRSGIRCFLRTAASDLAPQKDQTALRNQRRNE